MSTDRSSSKEKLEQKLGEALGLEMAAQKAVQELSSMGLLDKRGILSKLKNMQKEAGNHQSKLEQLVQKLSGSLDSATIQEAAQETEQKASEMMKTYLGKDPDSSEAMEFLCLAEGGEVTHYEVLSSISKNFDNKKLSTTAHSILKEEQDHLKRCLTMAKEAVSS